MILNWNSKKGDIQFLAHGTLSGMVIVKMIGNQNKLNIFCGKYSKGFSY
jgi:hypothetical protein